MKDFFDTKHLIVYLLAVIAGSVGGNIKDPRPDPFTGKEGEKLERRIDYLESDIAVIKTQLATLIMEERETRDYLMKRYPDWTPKPHKHP